MKKMPQPVDQDPSDSCGGCGFKERLFLHTLRYRGALHRFCTPCVLKHHSGFFCPVCFDVYGDSPPPPPQRLMCHYCPSISHLSCVVTPSIPPPTRYQCPPCSKRNYYYSGLFSSSHRNLKSSDELPATSAEPPPPRAVNMDLAKKLVTAARITSASMNKAASIARIEAERKVKEAVLARTGAKEALEQLACPAANREKEKEKEKGKVGSKPVVVDDPKVLPKFVDSVVSPKRIQNQIGTAVLGSPKNGLFVKGIKERNGLH